MLAEQTTERSSARPGRRLPSLVGAFLIGMAVAGTVWGMSNSQDDERSLAFGLFDPRVEQTDLLRGGEQVSLEEAYDRVDFPLLRPVDASASDATVAETWILMDESGRVSEAALRYESGLRLYLSTWPEAGDPAAFYEEVVRESGVGRTLEINGYPALAFEKDEQAPGYPSDNVVLVTIENVEVSMHADLSVDELLRIAGTLRYVPASRT